MISIGMSAVIAARRDSVWRALTTPAELIRWDDRFLELTEPASDYPTPDQPVHWRFLLRNIPITLRERPIEVVPCTRLRSEVSLGLFRFTSTYSLLAGDDPGRPTRVALSLLAENAIPIVGGALDRFAVRRAATEFVDTRLRLLKRWCEQRLPVPIGEIGAPRSDVELLDDPA